MGQVFQNIMSELFNFKIPSSKTLGPRKEKSDRGTGCDGIVRFLFPPDQVEIFLRQVKSTLIQVRRVGAR